MTSIISTQNENPRPVNLNKSPDKKLKVIPLGGVEEIGINCTVYEYGSDIIAVDMGLGFSEHDYYGIDYVVPDISYLVKRKNNLRGIVITHGHLDHIGALPFHLEPLGFPHLFGTRFTIELIKNKLEEKGILKQMESKLHLIDENSNIDLGKFNVKFFRVNHSIPQSVGVLIETPTARAIHTGDFKFDNSPINEPVADYAKIARFGEMGIDVLLSDSTNSLKKGHPISESDVAKSLEDITERAQGRVVFATFSGLVGRLYQLLEIARKHNRKVAIAGYSMRTTLAIAQEIGYIKVAKELIIPVQNINRFHPNRVMILTTGAQGEPEAALYKMATEDYKGFKLKPGDTVVLSARTIVGNDRAVQRMIDNITSRGAIVKQSEDLDLFTSGHGYQEDQKIMLNLVKPKYFMPVHGYQYFLRAHGETAKSVGMKPENVIIAQRGSVVEGSNKEGFKVTSKFNCEPWLVSGSGVGDIGASVLKEREQLANYGVVVINLQVGKDKKLIQPPFIVTRGFVYVKSSLELLREISNKAARIYDEVAYKTEEIAVVKERLTMEIGKFLYQETEREPVIITVVNFV